jgi:hypothetical protein
VRIGAGHRGRHRRRRRRNIDIRAY